MQFLVALFLVLGASVVKSALIGPPGAGPMAPGSTCGSNSKWEELTSFIGEEIIMKGKEKMMDKAKCCLNMKPPADLIPIYMKCFHSTVKITQQELGDGTAKTPTTKDWKRWYESAVACLIQEFNITTSSTGYDPKSLEMLHVEDWTDKSEDKIALRTIFNECIASSNGSTPVQHMISVQRCMGDKTGSLCKSRGHSEGVMIKVAKGFFSLWDESVCSGVQIPQKFDDTISVCVAKAQKQWEDDGLAKFTSTSMMKYNNSDVKNAMYFLKKYAQSFLVNLMECGAEEMTFYNATTSMFNYTAGEDFLTNLVGWNSPQVKESVVMAFKKCEVVQNETALMKMDEMEREITAMKTIMKFKKCYMAKFVDICGLNNDLASVFFPILNNKLVGSIGKDFKDKKGLLALMHLAPALQEKFRDFFTTMGMPTMEMPNMNMPMMTPS